MLLYSVNKKIYDRKYRLKISHGLKRVFENFLRLIISELLVLRGSSIINNALPQKLAVQVNLKLLHMMICKTDDESDKQIHYFLSFVQINQ